MTRWLALAALALWLAPDAAQACASCVSSQTEQTRYAFLWTTGFLSALPLGLFGILIWYVRRRARELAAREIGRREPGSEPERAALRLGPSAS